MEDFKKSVDNWIKEVDGRLSKVEHLAPNIEENAGNSNHNYELIKAMQKDIGDMRAEIANIRKMQLLVTKSVLENKGRNMQEIKSLV